jgi:hypothetical protein
MPNILLFVSPEKTEQVKSLLISELGKTLREATANALGDIEPHHVAVMAVPFFAGDNATDMQIFCVGSHSEAREPKLTAWAAALAEAWLKFSQEHDITWYGNVDIWPTLPYGLWMMAQEESTT